MNREIIMKFQQIDITGSRIVGTILDFGLAEIKHHGIIIGKNIEDNEIYVAESMHYGYQIATIKDFESRYIKNGEVKILELESDKSAFDIAQDALNEIFSTTKKKYHLIFNNCESFANKHIHGHSVSGQVVTAIGTLVLIGIGIWALVKKSKNKVV